MIEQFDRLHGAGKLGQARQLAAKLAQQHPDDPSAHDLARTAYMLEGQPRAALPHALRAAELDGENAGVQDSLAAVLSALGRNEEAYAAAQRAVTADPERVDLIVNAAAILLRLNRVSDCEVLCRAGVARFPDSVVLRQTLAAALLEQGRAAEAEGILIEALFEHRTDVMMSAHVCSIANYRAPADRARLIAQHKNFGRLLVLADSFTPCTHGTVPAGPAGRGAGGRIRIGFMSSDLRTHSVAYFLEPLLRRLPRARFEALAYATSSACDATTRRLQALVAAERLDDPDAAAPVRETGPTKNWRWVNGLSGEQIARRMVEDRVDILIDLNGLTLGARADSLRYKPAPVIATYLGYPATTGISAVDYRIVDSITDPPGSDDAATERLVRLDPCFLCYRAPTGTLAPLEPRMPAGEGVVFGSFNNFMKFNDEVARVWARVVNAVPGARLMLKAAALHDPSVRAQALRRMEAAGLDPARVELIERIVEVGHHLDAYSRVHIALDTFPYAGTTTTCEALHMGVPVVTLAPAGALHAQRVGASLLTALGAPEWVATTEDEYVRIAAALAADAAHLAALRATLRPRLHASVLCDEIAFAARFGAALEAMWANRGTEKT